MKKKWFLSYTVLWFLAVALIIFIFQKNGKNFLWLSDGAYQHFPSFNYVCEFLKKIFTGGDICSVGAINYSLGQGSDILTTLNSYDFTDPISWLCASLFFISRTARYAVMIFAKLWLVGAAFAIYNFILGKKDNLAILCGALMYTFSSALMFIFIRHPNYVNWAYFLPLILAGYELYKRKGKIHLLIATVFLNLLTNYYTFYMNVILLIIYLLVKNITNVINSHSLKIIGREFVHDLKVACLCFIGVFLDAITLFPLIYAYINNPRVAELTGYSGSSWHFAVDFYKSIITALFIPYTYGSNNSYIGLIPVSILGIIVLFMKQKKNLSLKILISVIAVLLCLPIFGRIMNGFGYSTNRWFYAVAFFVGVVFVEMFDDICQLSGIKKWITVSIGLLYVAVITFVFKDLFSGFLKYTTIAALVIVLIIFVVTSGKKEKTARISMFIMTIVFVLFSVGYTFYENGKNYVSQFMDSSSFDHYYDDSSLAAIESVSSENFYRVESLENTSNKGNLYEVYGTDIWYSLLPSWYCDYMNDFELNTISQNCRFEGLDNRTALLELASIKYYTSPVGKNSLVPFGYEYSEELSTDKYNVYENKYALTVGYAIEKYMTTEEYEQLSPLEKERAITQAVVLDEEKAALQHADDINVTITSLDYNITILTDIELTENNIKANKANATISLQAYVPDNCEIYVQINGIEINSPKNTSVYASRSENNGSYVIEKKGYITNKTYNWPVFHDSITFNLGVGGSGENTFTLRFSEKSSINYESIEIIAIPMDTYEEEAKALQEYSLENAHVDGSYISGDITLPNTRIVQISVPYSKGWKAYVDGVETEILKTDVMYMGIVVGEGSHHIELKYTIPYIKVGAIVSLIALLVWIAVALIQRRKDRLIVEKKES